MSQQLEANVDFDFDGIASFSIKLSAPTVENLCDQIDEIENKVMEWGEDNFPETLGQRIRRFFGFPTWRTRSKEVVRN